MNRSSRSSLGVLFVQSSPDHWAERWGSTIITLCLGLVSGMIAAVTPVSEFIPEPVEEPHPLIFELSPPLEAEAPSLLETLEIIEVPAPASANSRVPELTETVATHEKQEPTGNPEAPKDLRIGPAEEQPPLEAQPPLEEETQEFVVAIATDPSTPLDALQEAIAAEEEEPVEEEPFTIETWKPDDAAKEGKLNQLLGRAGKQEQQVQVQRNGVRAELNRREVETTGREFMFNSDGGREGIIRMLDVDGFPEEVVKKVYARYGIEVDYKYLRTEDLDTKRTYFNAVITDKENFTTKRESGYYEVFQLSSKAISLLAQLEREAVTAKQKDQRNTRVRSITFGIVLNSRDEYALGVTDLQFERLR